jgi:Gram-negative porin
MSNRPASGSQVPDRFISAATAALAPIPVNLLPAANKAAAIAGAAKAVADKAFGVNVDPPNAVFDRQAFVGLVTPIGAVLAGRQYTPAYEVAATFDTLQTQSSLAAGQVASFPPSIDIRASNAVAYRFEKGPFSGGLMYTVEAAPSASTLKGVSFMYKSEAASVGLGYNTHKNELGEKALTSTVLGAMVKIGPGYLSGLVGKVKDFRRSRLGWWPWVCPSPLLIWFKARSLARPSRTPVCPTSATVSPPVQAPSTWRTPHTTTSWPTMPTRLPTVLSTPMPCPSAPT